MSSLACADEPDVIVMDVECGPIGLNSADIPGGCGGAAALDAPLEMACGLLWEPIDFSPWHSPIGAALALEMAGKAAEPV